MKSSSLSSVLLVILGLLSSLLAANHRISFSKLNDKSEFNSTIRQIQNILLPVVSSDIRPENALMSRTLSLVSPLLELLCVYDVESSYEDESDCSEIQKFTLPITMLMNYSEISVWDLTSLNIFFLHSCTIESVDSIERVSTNIFDKVSVTYSDYKYDYFDCFVKYFKPQICFSQVKSLSTHFLPNELDSFVIRYSDKILESYLVPEFDVTHVFNILCLASRQHITLKSQTIRKLFSIIRIGLNTNFTETTVFIYLTTLKMFRSKFQDKKEYPDSDYLMANFADVVSCNGFWSIGSQFFGKNKNIEKLFFNTVYSCLQLISAKNLGFLNSESIAFFDSFTVLIRQQTKRVKLISENVDRITSAHKNISKQSLSSSLRSLEVISLAVESIYDEGFLNSVGGVLFKFNSSLMDLVENFDIKSLKDIAFLNSYLSVKILKKINFNGLAEEFTLFMAKVTGRIYSSFYSTVEDKELVDRIIKTDDVNEFTTELLSLYESKKKLLTDGICYSVLSTCINSLQNSQSLMRRLSICFIEHVPWDPNSFYLNLKSNHPEAQDLAEVLKVGFLTKLQSVDQNNVENVTLLYRHICNERILTKTEISISNQILSAYSFTN